MDLDAEKDNRCFLVAVIFPDQHETYQGQASGGKVRYGDEFALRNHLETLPSVVPLLPFLVLR